MKELVSVLMSVHNEPAEYIDEAVKSICQQTHNNIEFIIIDDASDEPTSSHLKELCNRYPIIQLYRNEHNIGLTASLNKGLSLTNGEFIARMDADDYSCPSRLEKQLSYFKNHPEIDILGTGVISFGQITMFMSPVNGASYKEVQSNLFFQSSLCHPSVMMRKRFLMDNNLSYDENVKKGQDYDFWERSSEYGKLAVMPDVLLYYRTHAKQITSTCRQEQDKTLEMVIRRRLKRIGVIPDEREMLCHLALMGRVNSIPLREIKAWVDKLVNHSVACEYIDTPTLRENLRQRYIMAKMKRHTMPSFNDLGDILRIGLQRIQLKRKLRKFKRE